MSLIGNSAHLQAHTRRRRPVLESPTLSILVGSTSQGPDSEKPTPIISTDEQDREITRIEREAELRAALQRIEDPLAAIESRLPNQP